jgi:hypothetical protein
MKTEMFNRVVLSVFTLLTFWLANNSINLEIFLKILNRLTEVGTMLNQIEMNNRTVWAVFTLLTFGADLQLCEQCRSSSKCTIG